MAPDENFQHVSNNNFVIKLLDPDLSIRISALQQADSMMDNCDKKGLLAVEEAIRIKSGYSECNFYIPGGFKADSQEEAEKNGPTLIALAKKGSLLEDVTKSGELISRVMRTNTGWTKQVWSVMDAEEIASAIRQHAENDQFIAFQLLYAQLVLKSRWLKYCDNIKKEVKYNISENNKNEIKNIRKQIWQMVGPTAMKTATADKFLELGNKAIPLIKNLFCNPTDENGFTVNLSVLASALIAFAKNGNKYAANFIHQVADGEIKLSGVDGNNALKLSKEFALENPSSKKIISRDVPKTSTKYANKRGIKSTGKPLKVQKKKLRILIMKLGKMLTNFICYFEGNYLQCEKCEWHGGLIRLRDTDGICPICGSLKFAYPCFLGSDLPHIHGGRLTTTTTYSIVRNKTYEELLIEEKQILTNVPDGWYIELLKYRYYSH